MAPQTSEKVEEWRAACRALDALQQLGPAWAERLSTEELEAWSLTHRVLWRELGRLPNA